MVAGVFRLVVPATRSAIDGCRRCEARCQSLCGSVSDGQLALFAGIVESVHARAHQRVISEGDPAQHTYNIVSGTAKLLKELPDGRQQIVGFLLTGDFFGLPADDAYPYSVEAIAETQLCRFRLDRFKAVLSRIPALESALRGRLVGDLAAAQEQMLALGQKSALERVAGFLLQLSARAGWLGLPRDPMHLPMTRSDIADYLGLTLETVSRCIGRLKERGLIAVHGRQGITVESIDSLAELAEGDAASPYHATEGDLRCRSVGS
jgi:CRP/FNR family transcriptional regulator